MLFIDFWIWPYTSSGPNSHWLRQSPLPPHQMHVNLTSPWTPFSERSRDLHPLGQLVLLESCEVVGHPGTSYCHATLRRRPLGARRHCQPVGGCPLGFLSGSWGTGNGERRPAPGSERSRTGLSGAITGRGRTAASRGNLVPGSIMIKRCSGNSPATTSSFFVGENSSPSFSLLSWLANILPLLLEPEVNAFWHPASLKSYHHHHHRHHRHCHHHGNSIYMTLAMH